MKLTTTILAATSLALTLSTTAHAAPQYVISADLGAFGDGSLNDSGVVSGTVSSGGVSQAVIYSGGSLQYLGTLGGASAQAFGINNAGVVVGVAQTSSGASHAFMYDGSMHDLGTFAGGTSSTALGINSSGQIVGNATTADGISHSFLYSNGVMQDLNAPTEGPSTANSINDAGQIAGSRQVPGGVYGPTSVGYIYSNGTMTNIAGVTNLMDINASGQAAGNDISARGSYQTIAMKYNGTNIVQIMQLGMFSNYAYGINDAGWVVGTSETGGYASDGNHAFLYSDARYDLNTLVLGAAGITFSSAIDINNLGQILATANNGHTYLLSLAPAVPLPASAWLLGSSLLGLASMARRNRTKNL